MNAKEQAIEHVLKLLKEIVDHSIMPAWSRVEQTKVLLEELKKIGAFSGSES